MGLLLSAIRQAAARSVEIAELAIRHRDEGVLGFDMAGPEAGYPPTRYLDAFHLIAHENFHFTLHAGEAFGLPSIWEALQWCGAERLGHGVRIVDDITVQPDGHVKLGRLSAYVRDRRVPLEMCPTSNVHIGAVRSIADHPIDLLRRLRFRVTVNTDNRLMSGISLTDEFAALARTFGIGLEDMEWLTLNGIKSAFLPFDGRLRIINEQVKPGFARLRAAAVRRGAGDRLSGLEPQVVEGGVEARGLLGGQGLQWRSNVGSNRHPATAQDVLDRWHEWRAFHDPAQRLEARFAEGIGSVEDGPDDVGEGRGQPAHGPHRAGGQRRNDERLRPHQDRQPQPQVGQHVGQGRLGHLEPGQVRRPVGHGPDDLGGQRVPAAPGEDVDEEGERRAGRGGGHQVIGQGGRVEREVGRGNDGHPVRPQLRGVGRQGHRVGGRLGPGMDQEPATDRRPERPTRRASARPAPAGCPRRSFRSRTRHRLRGLPGRPPSVQWPPRRARSRARAGAWPRPRSAAGVRTTRAATCGRLYPTSPTRQPTHPAPAGRRHRCTIRPR